MLSPTAIRRTLRALAALPAAFAAIADAPAQEAVPSGPAPIVVELYTSQGCNSCPEADAYFGELVQQPGIVALAFHVDYWNYLGWRDPYAAKKFTYRQKEYAMSFRQTGVYTPQIVVQGRRGEVGSDRKAVARMIAEARRKKPVVTIVIEKLPGNRLRAVIQIPAEAQAAVQGAYVWAALLDRRQTTKVPRGENEGKTLVNHNIVREWRKLGAIGDPGLDLGFAAVGEKGEKRGAAAVLVQQPKAGPILGAAMATLD